MNREQVYYCHFNNKLTEFLKDLIATFPDDKDLKLFKNSFDLLKLSDENKPAILFNKIIKNFENKIYDKDESFFLDKDYSNIVDNNVDITTSLIDKLKTNWINLSVDDKEIVWKYLILLCKLSNKCCGNDVLTR